MHSPRTRRALLSLFAAVLASACALPPRPAPVRPEALDLEALLRTYPERFGPLLARADAHRLRIELGVVDTSTGRPQLVRSSLSFGPEYVYPASSIKTCAVIAALVRMRAIAHETGAAVDRNTPLRFHPLFAGEALEDTDPSHLADGTITLAHDAAKVLLVSDNAAFNRLYEFAGPALVNELMHGAGLTSCRVVHRLSEFRSPEDQLRLPAIDLLGPEGADGARPVLVSLPERTETSPGTNAGLAGLRIGSKHVAGNGPAVEDGPLDFTHKNHMAAADLLGMNVALLRPDVDRGTDGFPLSDGDRAFIAALMASTPGASTDPVYDRDVFPDTWSKPLAPGLWRLRAPEDLEIRDKTGRAYGFTISNSHVRDRVTGAEFFLTAILYTNANDVVGDGVYEYETADRFLADLGEVVGRTVLGAEGAPGPAPTPLDGED